MAGAIAACCYEIPQFIAEKCDDILTEDVREIKDNLIELVEKRKKETLMKIIFLDFDGVMDTAYYDLILRKNGLPEKDNYGVLFDPNCIKNLKHIIDNTGADIVVSSSWKEDMGYEEILKMWEDRRLPGFVTDVTPTLFRCNNRGDEIDAWLNDCNTECQYVIIDDLRACNFNEHQIPRLLIVNPYNGLDEITAEKAIGILNSNG